MLMYISYVILPSDNDTDTLLLLSHKLPPPPFFLRRPVPKSLTPLSFLPLVSHNNLCVAKLPLPILFNIIYNIII